MYNFKALTFILIFQSMTLFNFTTDSDISNWSIVDDVVMGGRSDGNMSLNKEGHAEYTGEISLKNNGGFSSLRYYFKSLNTANFSKFILKVKGDGKAFQFRVKDNRNYRYSYIVTFATTGDWQTIEIPFSKMYGSYRGRILDIPNFEGKQMEEITFLIGNKKEENFRLLINSISLE
jgi:NADH dehydrogenase [ubiquinone] 1 alpha subcomplex assembly factor 1